MLTRRGFLGLIGALSFVGSAGLRGNPMAYKGYDLVWTGWKAMPEYVELCAQWIAHPPDPNKLRLYVSIPGYMGRMRRGEAINICHFAHQHWVYSDSSERFKNQIKELTRKEMIGLIDSDINNTLDKYIEDRMWPARRIYANL